MSETKTQAAAAPAAPGQGPKPTTELKVSGHLMSFDAGLFCIFAPPGGPAPDPATGLPGMRLSLPPGPAFHPEAINISTFREDGWLGGWNGAALVRVARGPAQVLVTIYQAPNAKGEAPKLQILKLADGAAQPAARPAAPPQAAAPAPSPKVAVPAPPGLIAVPSPPSTPAGGATPAPGDAEISAHVQVRGDITAQLGDWVGTAGSKQWVEGFAISPRQIIAASDIEYQAVLGRGWLSPWAEGGQYCGSRGMSLPILGLRVRLRGEAAQTHDCVVTATFVDGSKIGPLDNGEPAQAETLSPLEAFRVVVSPRGTAAAAPSARQAPAPVPRPAKPVAKKPPPPAPKAAPKAPAKPAPRRK